MVLLSSLCLCDITKSIFQCSLSLGKVTFYVENRVWKREMDVNRNLKTKRWWGKKTEKRAILRK